MINPQWFEAAADLATAVERGVAMRGGRKTEQGAAVPAAPTFVVNNSGLSKEDFLLGMLILAAAILAAALIIHHGLTV